MKLSFMLTVMALLLAPGLSSIPTYVVLPLVNWAAGSIKYASA